MYTVGFVKDAIAAVLFTVSATVIHRASLQIITAGLVTGAIVDGLFTLHPEWHCQKWSSGSAPSILVYLQVLVFLYLLSQCR